MRLELQSVKKIYGSKTALDIDKLEFEKGKIYAVLGTNGSGKTTMLRIIAGVDRADSGHIYYDGSETHHGDLAYMPQNTYMFHMTALENVMLGLKNHGESGEEVEERALHALERVGMSTFKNAKAQSLSGGEAQRVALARTLVLGKSLILLDEPASSTDIAGVEIVEKYIKTVNEKDKVTIIFTTHNPSQAARIADEVVMMHYGHIAEKDKTANIFNSPQMQETKEFLKSWRI